MNEQTSPFVYELNGDKSIRITGYTGDAVLLTVPAEIDGHKVADIGMFAFTGCPHLRHVILSEGIVTLYVNAFYDCPVLESVHLPDTIENSVNNSVRYCPSFQGYKLNETNTEFYAIDGVLFQTEINQLCDYPAAKQDAEYVLPADTLAIASGVFAEHPFLQRVVCNEGLTQINDAAFRECPQLQSVVLPSTLEKIGAQAFASCAELDRISIPASVREIGPNAFTSCWKLETVKCAKDSEHFTLYNGALCDKALKTILRCPVSEREYHLPEGFERVAAGAFSGCSTLYAVQLPQSLKTIEGSAFSHCGTLTSIEIPEGITEIHPATFLGCTSLKMVTLPDSVKTVGQTAFWYCPYLTSIEVAADAEIDENAFGGDPELMAMLGESWTTEIIRRK